MTTNELDAKWAFDNTYATLPSPLFVEALPTPVKQPEMAVFNHQLAEDLGLDNAVLASEQGARVFSGNSIPVGAKPIAQAYAGHQFGNFTMLGDGRAILLGEHVTPNGERVDVQLKGSGPTPFSRRGDGRAALGPMLREYIISEAMHALGIPTTRSLAVVTTGEPVYRDRALPGAILTRIAASHIRVGTFEFAAGLQDPELLRSLTHYTLRRHFPELVDEENPAVALIEAVQSKQATLLAQWLHVGFIHGVMNTDNMALSGETIDYGPCAFMDQYDPATVFSSIDRNGRYAYANQPGIAHWNLARLAESLLPLLHPEEKKAIESAQEILGKFPAYFQSAWLTGMRGKLGLFNAEPDDAALAEDLLAWMHAAKVDYTFTFSAITTGDISDGTPWQDREFSDWLGRWQSRVSRQTETLDQARARMRAHNPAFIPRNHLVEAALHAAQDNGDFGVMERLLDVLAAPYDYDLNAADYRKPPASDGSVYQTFCGT